MNFRCGVEWAQSCKLRLISESYPTETLSIFIRISSKAARDDVINASTHVVHLYWHCTMLGCSTKTIQANNIVKKAKSNCQSVVSYSTYDDCEIWCHHLLKTLKYLEKPGKSRLVHLFWCFWLTIWTGCARPVHHRQSDRCTKKGVTREWERDMRQDDSKPGPARPFQMSISIYSSSQSFLRRAIDTVMWVCHSQDPLGGEWTSAVSEVLSCEITDLIKSSPSHLLLFYLPHLNVRWHLFTSPKDHTTQLFLRDIPLWNSSFGSINYLVRPPEHSQ